MPLWLSLTLLCALIWAAVDGLCKRALREHIRMVGTTKSYEFTNTDPGTSSFRYDPTSKAWYFNLQTKDNLGAAYPIDTYDIMITPSPSGYLPPSPSPFK